MNRAEMSNLLNKGDWMNYSDVRRLYDSGVNKAKILNALKIPRSYHGDVDFSNEVDFYITVSNNRKSQGSNYGNWPEVAKKNGISSGTFYRRVKDQGMTAKQAATQPTRRRKKSKSM